MSEGSHSVVIPGKTRKITDLSNARILVTNDDGIQAPGLKVLEAIAKSLSDDVWVVAPEIEQSAMSHALTLRRPLQIKACGEKRFAIDGTPTDCVVLSSGILMKDHLPDLVLSGVNWGSNMGDDVTYSGTVAAAMEATLLGIPAIAFSLSVLEGQDPLWKTAETHASSIVQRLVGHGWPEQCLFNVNFPALPPENVLGIRAVKMGHFQGAINVESTQDPKQRPYYWIGDFEQKAAMEEGTDIAVLEEGFISVTPIKMNLTDLAELKRLNHIF